MLPRDVGLNGTPLLRRPVRFFWTGSRVDPVDITAPQTGRQTLRGPRVPVALAWRSTAGAFFFPIDPVSSGYLLTPPCGSLLTPPPGCATV